MEALLGGGRDDGLGAPQQVAPLMLPTCRSMQILLNAWHAAGHMAYAIWASGLITYLFPNSVPKLSPIGPRATPDLLVTEDLGASCVNVPNHPSHHEGMPVPATRLLHRDG